MQECAHGDLDLGSSGDGRWPLKWKVIDCPNNRLSFETQGSHAYYGKLKATGGPSGVDRMTCNGNVWQPTPDGFFVYQDNSGRLCEGVTCDIYFVNGIERREYVPGGIFC